MPEATTAENVHLAAFRRLEHRLPGAPIPAIRRLRREAIERFVERGFPTTRDEAWRHTNVSRIASLDVVPGPSPPAPDAPTARRDTPAGLGAATLVLVDGHAAPALSDLAGVPNGVRFGPLSALLADEPALIAPAAEAALSRHGDAFCDLNAALWSDGAFLFVPDHAVVERPIHILHIASGARAAGYARNVLVVGEHAEASIVETHATATGGPSLAAPVTDLVVGPASVVHHHILHVGAEDAFHVGALRIGLGRASSVRSHLVALGGAIARHNIDARFGGEGGELLLNGVFAPRGSQHVDIHTAVDHAAPSCTSREIVKGVLDGASRGVFTGRIVVRPGAQKTNGLQTNKNLILSDKALVESLPQLEIYADDVKCTHGSTTGQLDEEQVFYLRSRGLDAAAARALLTFAFTGEVTDRIRLAPLRRHVERLLLARLPGGPDVARTLEVDA